MKAKLYWISLPVPWSLLGNSLVLFIEFIGLNMALRFSRNYYEAIHDQWSGLGQKLVCSWSITAVLLLMQLGVAGMKRKSRIY
jgi:hypothetical protein